MRITNSPRTRLRMEDSPTDGRCIPRMEDEQAVEEYDAFRRRAVSEVVRNEISPHRWKLVAAWSSLRRSRDAKRNDLDDNELDKHDVNECKQPVQNGEQKNTTQGHVEETQKKTDNEDPVQRNAQRPRRRVSLFLRKRGTSAQRYHSSQPPYSATFNTDQNVQQNIDQNNNSVCDNDCANTETYAEEDRRQFRRAQSHLVKPVSFSDADCKFPTRGGEGGRYLEYAADLDDDSFERLKDLTRNAIRKYARPSTIRLTPKTQQHADSVNSEGAFPRNTSDVTTTNGNASNGDGNDASVVVDLPFDSERVSAPPSSHGKKAVLTQEEQPVLNTDDHAHEDAHSDEIIGEICLEDFADVDSEDFDFLDGQIVDVWTDGASPDGRPSLRLDSQKLTWIGNESEFSAFFAEVGLDDIFEVEKPSEEDMQSFRISPSLLSEWEAAGEEHNSIYSHWAGLGANPIDAGDIRRLVNDFYHTAARRVNER